jgi:hypothetical protein
MEGPKKEQELRKKPVFDFSSVPHPDPDPYP